jgi:hypothetical protein
MLSRTAIVGCSHLRAHSGVRPVHDRTGIRQQRPMVRLSVLGMKFFCSGRIVYPETTEARESGYAAPMQFPHKRSMAPHNTTDAAQ